MKTMNQLEKRPTSEVPQAEPQRAYLSPRVNITETKDGYVLQAEMPGVDKSGLEISLENNELSIVGRRRSDTNGLEVLYRESTNRDYRRVFSLDPTIDTGRIDAKMDNGVLRLNLPKADHVKPRKIQVTG